MSSAAMGIAMKLLILFAILVTSLNALSEDGKVFVKTDPVGAAVFLKDSEKALGKTAGVVVVPQGKQVLVFKLIGYKDTELEVDVQGTGIIKPEIVVLEKLASQIDIIFGDDGWRVFIDKKSLNDTGGKLAMTPCTVMLTNGAHEIGLAKDGFADISQKIDVKENGAVEIKAKPVKGVSVLLKTDKSVAVSETSKVANVPVKKLVSKQATYTASSYVPEYKPKQSFLDGTHYEENYRGVGDDRFAFHTKEEKDPHVIIDLKAVTPIDSVAIGNRKEWGHREKGLTVWISNDDKGPWTKIWDSPEAKSEWEIIPKDPIRVRFIKIGLVGAREILNLNWVKVFGK